MSTDAPEQGDLPLRSMPQLPRHKRIVGMVLRTWPLILACGVAFALEHHLLGMLSGHDRSSPLMQGLFSARSVYGYAVSTWPRELTPRYTAIVHIDPGQDATARGLANNVCLQRDYLARLLPVIADLSPAILVIDKYFTRDGCTLAGPTARLVDAVDAVSLRLPVVTGLLVEQTSVTEMEGDAATPLLVAPLAFANQPKLRHGLVNIDVVPRRIPLGWTVRPEPGAKPEWRNGLALEAALVREPRLLTRVARLDMLKAQRQHPYTSMIAPVLFNIWQAADILCANKATAGNDMLACAGAKPPHVDLVELSGRIVILGETGASIDRHDTLVIGRVPGTVLQANYVESLLDGRFYWPAPEWLNYAVGLVIFTLLELALQGREAWKVLLRVSMLLVATFGVLALSVRFLGYYIDPSVGVLVLVFMLVGWIRERIAHRVGSAS